MTTNFACEPSWPGNASSESGATSTQSRADYSVEARRALGAIYRLAVRRALEARNELGSTSGDAVESYYMGSLTVDANGERSC